MFFAIIGAASAIAGIGLLLKSSLLEVFERQRRVERFIYRHHRLFGAAIAAAALLLLVLIGMYHHRTAETSVWRFAPGVQAAMIAAYALAVFALIVGIYVGIRPSALKRVEALANRWIEPFPRDVSGVAPLNVRRNFIRGMLLLLTGLACLVAAAKMATA
jgi:cell division protein FtsW (lipid II flippase)